jgi:hypothetical protein
MDHLRRAPVDPTGAREISRPASRIYGSLVLIAYLLARIDHSNETRDKLRDLVEEFADGRPGRLGDMGFPQGWQDEEIWQATYARDATLAAQAVMLRNVVLLYTADASAQLTKKKSLKERSSLLNYYRKKGALLSVPGTEAHRYPAFQFDGVAGDVDPVVITANRRLLGGAMGSEEQRWAALEWWTTPNSDVSDGLSPHRAFEAGALPAEVLDVLLHPLDDE